MRAVLCKAFGPPEELVVEEVPSPEPAAGQVRIEVHAASVNYPDFLIIQDRYQFKPPLPFTPGADVSGRVAELGPGVERLRVGDRVIASGAWGGFAEELVVDESRCSPIPAGMSHPTAAAFLMACGTSYYALKRRGRVGAGDTLLVLGAAGGVGLAAVELGKAMGASVIAAASSEEKLSLCRERGADETLLYPVGDLGRDDQRALSGAIKGLTDGRGADLVYDPVGGAYSEPALRATAWGGRFLVVGFAAGGIPNPPLNLPLLKGCDVVGVFWGSYTAREPDAYREDLGELTRLHREGRIDPHVSRTYSLDDAHEAIRALGSREAVGKLVIRVRDGD